MVGTQEQQLVIDTTIPLWTLVTGIATSIGTAIWALITLYFSDKARKLKEVEILRKIDEVKEESSKALYDYKIETDKKLDEVNKSVISMRDTLIEVKTMCTLLIGNKIKKDD